MERALGVRGSAGGVGGLMPLNYIPKCGEGRVLPAFYHGEEAGQELALVHRMLSCHSPIVLPENKVHS